MPLYMQLLPLIIYLFGLVCIYLCINLFINDWIHSFITPAPKTV